MGLSSGDSSLKKAKEEMHKVLNAVVARPVKDKLKPNGIVALDRAFKAGVGR